MYMAIGWLLEKLDQAYHAGYLPKRLGRKFCDALDSFYTSG